MKKIEFKSQICTTQEQSQKLLDMGLKPETADMVYHFTGSKVEAMQWELQANPPTLRGEFWTEERIARLVRGGESGEEVFDRIWGKDVPAWSLSRLLKLLPNKIKVSEQEFIFSLTHEYDGSWCASYCGIKFFIKGAIFEACTSMIEWLIETIISTKTIYNEKERICCRRSVSVWFEEAESGRR